MNAFRRWVSVAMFVAVSAGLIALVPGAPAEAKGGGPKLCPEIYAPVICDNGKVYPNQCYADRAHAKNCVPYGDI